MSRKTNGAKASAKQRYRPVLFVFVLIIAACIARTTLAHVPHDVIQDIVVSPGFSVDQQVFTTVRGRLFRSNTGGYEWQVLSRGLTCAKNLDALAISPAFVRDRTLFVSCESGGLYRSIDGGDHWQQLESAGADTLFRSVLISPRFDQDRSIVAVADEGVIWRSTDAGDSWSKVSAQSPFTALAWRDGHLAAGGRDGLIYISVDKANQWQVFARLPSGTEITAILPPLDRNIDGNWYIGSEVSGIIRLGPTGEVLPGDNLVGQHIMDLASTDLDGETVVFATTWQEAVYRSMDKGLSWQKFDSGLARNVQADRYGEAHFSKLVVANDATVIAGGFVGIFISTDIGETWDPISVALHHITSLAVSPAYDGGYAIALAMYGGGSIVSFDSGETWRAHNIDLRNPRLGPIAFSPDFARDGAMFTGSFNSVMESRGRGAPWGQQPLPPKYSLDWFRVEAKRLSRKYSFIQDLLEWTDSDLTDAFVFPVNFLFSPDYIQDGTLYAIGYPAGLLRSVDRGKTFEVVQNSWSGRIASIVAAPKEGAPAVLYASLASGLSRSDDSGESWVPLRGTEFLAASQLLAYSSPAGRTELFAGTEEGIFASLDNGESWHRRLQGAEGIGPVRTFEISPDFSRDRLMLLQHAGGPLQRCIAPEQHEEDIACRPVSTVSDFSHLVVRDTSSLVGFSPSYANDGTLYAASARRLMKSTDRANTWSEVPITRRFEIESILTDWMHLPIKLNGEWGLRRDSGKSGMRSVASAKPGDELAFRFYGSGVRWIGTNSPTGGMAQVFIDGMLVSEVNQRGQEAEYYKTSFDSGDLGRGVHSLTVRVLGSGSGDSSGEIDIDAIDVLP